MERKKTPPSPRALHGDWEALRAERAENPVNPVRKKHQIIQQIYAGDFKLPF